MSTAERASVPADVMADGKALVDHIASRTWVEPALAQRIRERAERVTEELRRKHGELNMAVELIRGARDDE